MVDFLQQIIQFFNINCSVVNCYYANPLEGMFYLVFLPSILLILLIWFISDGVMSKLGREHKGLSLLIALAVYIYIIIQNLYTLFVSLGQVWIVLVIIVGIIWFALRMIFGRPGGGGAMPGLRSMPGLGGRLMEKAKRGGKTRTEGGIEKTIKNIEATISQIKSAKGSGAPYDRIYEVATTQIRTLDEQIGQLESEMGSLYPPLQTYKKKSMELANKLKEV